MQSSEEDDSELEEEDENNESSSEEVENKTMRKLKKKQTESRSKFESEGTMSTAATLQKDSLKMKKNRNTSYKSKLPKKSTDILKNWFLQHIQNPYPCHEAKETLSKLTSLSRKQIQNWFTNTRKVDFQNVLIYRDFLNLWRKGWKPKG